MNSPPQNHSLIIYDQPEPRQIFLSDTTYSIGRDSHNGIVIPHNSISRQHALLLRMPLLKPGQYGYRLLDGNSAGQPSLNGLLINGIQRATWDLKSGDTIILGGAVALIYKTIDISLGDKYSNYIKFQTPETKGLKVKVVNSTSTLICESNLVDEYPSVDQQLLLLKEIEEGSLFADLFGSIH